MRRIKGISTISAGAEERGGKLPFARILLDLMSDGKDREILHINSFNTTEGSGGTYTNKSLFTAVVATYEEVSDEDGKGDCAERGRQPYPQ